MNLDELNSSYSVLYPFTYGRKTILVCWDEKQFKYCHFESKDDKFTPIKSKALDSFLTPYTKPEVFLESDEDGKIDDASIENLKNEVFKNIMSFLNGCAEDTINKAKKNFESLIVKYDDLEKNNVSGLYLPLENKILIKRNVKAPLFAHVLTHEMLHCVSNTNSQKLGFRYFETLKYLNRTSFCKYSHTILNEAFTEYFAQKIEPTNLKFYGVPVEMLKSFISFCDEKTLKQYFFDSNLKGFINYLTDNFKQSTGEITRLSLLFDACQKCYDATLNAQNSTSLQNANFEASTIALCNCITKMVVDKYKTDNTLKIEDLSFDDIFKDETQKLLLDFKIDIKKIKSFFKFYKNQKYVKYSTSPLDFQYFSNKFMDYFINNLPLPITFPEEFKCFEVYQQVLSHTTEVRDSYNQTFTKQKMFRRLFSPDYNYLPQNEDDKVNVVMHYIEIMDMYDFDITKYMDPNLVIKAISKNKMLFKKMCQKDVYFLFNYQRNLPQDLQKAPIFYKTLIDQLVEEGNQNALQILTRYVYMMDDKTIKSLVKKMEFLSYLQNSKLINEKDFLMYKNELISYANDQEYDL